MAPSTSTLGKSPSATNLEKRIAELSDSAVYAIAGASAGVISGVVVCPLDVVKTKLQAQGGFSQHGIISEHYYNGLRGTISTIWRTEGFKGFYRGVVPIVLGYLPTWMVYFTIYEEAKRLLGQNKVFQDHPSVAHIVAALCAGSASTTVTNPIWVVKTRLMTQSPHTSWHYSGTWDAFHQMFRKEGLGSFYAGLAPALLGLTHVAVQFPLYEEFKSLLVPTPESNPSESHKVGGIILASSMSKMLASVATYPHEVIRTRMQIQKGLPSNGIVRYKGIVHTFKVLLHEEGWRVFYSGLGTNLVRTVPASAVTLITYEVIVEHLTDIKKKQSVLE
ncbi:mitochondrial carrier domain-containing protein [Dipodascopsis tothii]|uniref:mitochondrial carrier domain-containing protein n=1 Tax=Dipodascopsis tothii TaxID=44089 RepID=UPI0034CDF3F3